MPLQNMMNSSLDKLVHPEIYINHQALPAFKAFLYIGLALCTLAAMALAAYQGLNLWIMAEVILVLVGSFFIFLMLIKIITGEERFRYYYMKIMIIIVGSILLMLLHQPILSYLDVIVLMTSLCLACCRIGCTMTGCCHGRPHRLGVCYRKEHAAAGFTPYYVGVRLFPIQVVESIIVLCIVVLGIKLLLMDNPPGSVLAWDIVAYGTCRFYIEFLRGDPRRIYIWRLSEAQWISVLLTGIVVSAELAGIFNLHLLHVGAMISIVLAAIAVQMGIPSCIFASYQLLHPHHVREIAELLENISHQAPNRDESSTSIQLGTTHLGIQISSSTIKATSGWIDHYTLSYNQGIMTNETAKTIAILIRQLRHSISYGELILSNQGIYHLLIPLSTK